MKVFDKNLTFLDYIALGFIGCQVVVLLLNWDFLPTAELDTPYHLLMGKMFADYDRIMLWDYYEYAPLGRPHLYPPLEHILLWFMHDITGADWWSIGRFISLIQYPLPMFTVWFFSRKLFSPVTALASVVFLSISNEFWFWQVSVAPTALILSLYPLFMYSFYRKKTFSSIVLLTSFLYLHLGLPYIIILCTFIFSVMSLFITREYVKEFVKVTGISAVLFLPWVIHIFLNRDWLRFGSPGQVSPLVLIAGINIMTVIFFVFGFLKCVEKFRVDLKYALVLSSCIGFLAVAVYGWRYDMHSPIINSVVTGIGFSTVYTRISNISLSRRKAAAAVLLLLIPLGTFSVVLFPFTSAMAGQPGRPGQPGRQRPGQPGQFGPGSFIVDRLQFLPAQRIEKSVPSQIFQKLPPDRKLPDQPVVHVQPSPLVEMLNSLRTGKRPPRVWQITNPEIDELVQWIKTNTSEDEILHLNNGMLATYLSLFTGRRIDTGMYREVTSPELFQAIQEGKKSGIFIVEKEQFTQAPVKPGTTVLEQFGNLLVIQGVKPEKIPHTLVFHLNELFVLVEHLDPVVFDQWATLLSEVRPKTVYLGVRQKDVDNPQIQAFITRITPLCEVRLSIIVEKPDISVSVSGITALRLVLPQEKISYEFVKSVRDSLDPSLGLEIAVLGPPLSQNPDSVETLLQVAPLVNRVVRHIPPNVEFLHAVQSEFQLFADKFFLQIDTYRGQTELQPEELYMLLQEAQQRVGGRIILEFRYPPLHRELIEFLKMLYIE